MNKMDTNIDRQSTPSSTPEPAEFETVDSAEVASTSAPVIPKRGPTPKNLIWEHFTVRSAGEMTKAKAAFSCCNYCEYKNNGKNISTLLHHLTRNHHEEAAGMSEKKQKLEEEEAQKFRGTEITGRFWI